MHPFALPPARILSFVAFTSIPSLPFSSSHYRRAPWISLFPTARLTLRHPYITRRRRARRAPNRPPRALPRKWIPSLLTAHEEVSNQEEPKKRGDDGDCDANYEPNGGFGLFLRVEEVCGVGAAACRISMDGSMSEMEKETHRCEWDWVIIWLAETVSFAVFCFAGSVVVPAGFGSNQEVKCSDEEEDKRGRTRRIVTPVVKYSVGRICGINDDEDKDQEGSALAVPKKPLAATWKIWKTSFPMESRSTTLFSEVADVGIVDRWLCYLIKTPGPVLPGGSGNCREEGTDIFISGKLREVSRIAILVVMGSYFLNRDTIINADLDTAYFESLKNAREMMPQGAWGAELIAPTTARCGARAARWDAAVDPCTPDRVWQEWHSHCLLGIGGRRPYQRQLGPASRPRGPSDPYDVNGPAQRAFQLSEALIHEGDVPATDHGCCPCLVSHPHASPVLRPTPQRAVCAFNPNVLDFVKMCWVFWHVSDLKTSHTNPDAVRFPRYSHGSIQHSSPLRPPRSARSDLSKCYGSGKFKLHKHYDSEQAARLDQEDEPVASGPEGGDNDSNEIFVWFSDEEFAEWPDLDEW
ncbi:hypothetical protein C8R45DRAFT_942454 [Mycena sanguinolenta]|nr:hypothetical protein C8R45DRAFT_942454 [Mycena sanguinolenta]